MSENHEGHGVCQFCGGPDEEDGKPTNSGTCGWCFYGMRLDPDGWAADLKDKGCAPPVYRGGCIEMQITEGDGRSLGRQKKVIGSAIVCRDPYVPGLKAVKP